MSKTVIIHGKRASATEPSPRLDREYAELWCGYMGQHSDWTRRFDPHPVEHTKHYPDGIKGRRPDVWEYYKSLPSANLVCGNGGKAEWKGRPVYLLDKHPEVAASASYPLAQAQRVLGNRADTRRLTCTVDMQILLAMAEGFEHIILHNVGLITDDWETTALNPEWQMKHKGILYWIGVAESGGYTITVEGDSIFAPPTKLYGYETCGRDFGVAQRRYFTRKR